ncbi:MAG: hypothetical protein WCA08_25400 [Desulfoferrobacter sp.]
MKLIKFHKRAFKLVHGGESPCRFVIDPGYQIPDNESVAAVQSSLFFIRHLASSIRYLLEPGSYFRRAVLGAYP